MAAINLSDLSYLLWIRPIVVVVMAALALMAARLRARGRIDLETEQSRTVMRKEGALPGNSGQHTPGIVRNAG